MARPEMTSEEFDEYFDNGGDTTPFIVPGSVRRPSRGKADRKVSLTMPGWLVDELDAEASRLASSRQAVINMRLADYFDAKRGKASA